VPNCPIEMQNQFEFELSGARVIGSLLYCLARKMKDTCNPLSVRTSTYGIIGNVDIGPLLCFVLFHLTEIYPALALETQHREIINIVCLLSSTSSVIPLDGLTFFVH